MRAPISGILANFRMEKGGAKENDFGVLEIFQQGNATLPSDLIFVFVEDFELCSHFIHEYHSGTLRWIDLYCYQVHRGRETVWVLERIFEFYQQEITVESAEVFATVPDAG